MAHGRVDLIPKSTETAISQTYRSIIYLPTCYKTFIEIISKGRSTHIEENEIFPDEQKGCCMSPFSCKDQLVINKGATKVTRRMKKDISMA